jgi:hypothetical protein
MLTALDHAIVPCYGRRMFRIIRLDHVGTFGVYASGRRGPYGTPLMFRGTLDECIAWRKGQA